MQCSSGKARAKEIREKEREKVFDFGIGKPKERASPIRKEKGLERTKSKQFSGKGKCGNAVRQVQIDEVPEGSSNAEAASSSSGPPSKPAVR